MRYYTLGSILGGLIVLPIFGLSMALWATCVSIVSLYIINKVSGW